MKLIKIWTIISETDDVCHQWKVTRMNSKSSSSESIIIEEFGTSCMIFVSRELLNYDSSSREKEENFDNLCHESS